MLYEFIAVNRNEQAEGHCAPLCGNPFVNLRTLGVSCQSEGSRIAFGDEFLYLGRLVRIGGDVR